MNRLNILLIVTVSVFISLVLVSNSVLMKNTSTFAVPTPPETNLPADVESVTFDKEIAYTWCPLPDNYDEYNSCPKDKQKVTVTTVVKFKKSDKLNYHYTVSGGKIVGQGAKSSLGFFCYTTGRILNYGRS